MKNQIDNIEDFKIEEIEQRLEMGTWCFTADPK